MGRYISDLQLQDLCTVARRQGIQAVMLDLDALVNQPSVTRHTQLGVLPVNVDTIDRMDLELTRYEETVKAQVVEIGRLRAELAEATGRLLRLSPKGLGAKADLLRAIAASLDVGAGEEIEHDAGDYL